MEIIVFLIVSYVLLSISLYFLFPKAGEAGWKGLIPGLNFAVWSRLVGRKPIYALWLLFPVVNLFIYAGLAVDMARSFRKYSFGMAALSIIYTPAVFFFLAFSGKEKYDGPTLEKEKAYQAQLEEAKAKKNTKLVQKLEAQSPYKKGFLREWTEAIVFAIFAAAFIRMFLIEAYVIPTPSMEGSLLVGDFLFVSKAHYGIRTPKTILMVPLLHNRTPLIDRESYFADPDLPFTRLPALEKIDRNDPVVFNYPEGDSVYVVPGRTYSVYDVARNPQQLGEVPANFPLTVRPLDKKDHYIKRCVAIPGDSIQIINRQLYVNGQPARNPTEVQFTYRVIFPGGFNKSKLDEWGISPDDIRQQAPNQLVVVLSEKEKQKLQSLDPALTIEDFDVSAQMLNPHNVFPYDTSFTKNWTIDNYGPLYVPAKGATVSLTVANLAPYRRIIEVYEGNKLEIRDGQIRINDQAATSYTFKMDYYWMMGDNRHNSEDSRIWGFVPEDHVVGKPLFIWLSAKGGNLGNGIRWNRIFTSASKS